MPCHSLPGQTIRYVCEILHIEIVAGIQLSQCLARMLAVLRDVEPSVLVTGLFFRSLTNVSWPTNSVFPRVHH